MNKSSELSNIVHEMCMACRCTTY